MLKRYYAMGKATSFNSCSEMAPKGFNFRSPSSCEATASLCFIGSGLEIWVDVEP